MNGITNDEMTVIYDILVKMKDSIEQELTSAPELDYRKVNAAAACNILMEYAASECVDDLG